MTTIPSDNLEADLNSLRNPGDISTALEKLRNPDINTTKSNDIDLNASLDQLRNHGGVGLDNVENTVPNEDRYSPQSGLVGKTFEAMDYQNNIARSALMAKTKGEDVSKWIQEAAAKQRYTSMDDLGSTFGEAIGLPNMGKRDNKFQMGDVPDFIRDFTIENAIDPLTYELGVLGGVVAKGAAKGVVKGGQILSKIAPKLPIGGGAVEALGHFLTGAKPRDLVAGAVTGGGAAVTADSDSTPIEKAALIATMAGLPAAAFRVVPGAAKLAAVAGNATADALAISLKGPQFAGLSAAKTIVDDALRKVQSVASEVSQGRLNVFKKANKKEKGLVSDMMADTKTEFVKRREFALSEEPPYKKGTQEYKIWFNELNDQIAKDMSSPGGFVDQLKADKTTKIKNLFDQFTEHNANVVKKINEEIYNIPGGFWDKETGRGLAGVKFHIDDPVIKASAATMDESMTAINRKGFTPVRSLNRSSARTELGSDLSYRIYANDLAKHWIEPLEGQAMKMVAEYRAAPGVNYGKNLMVKSLAALDRMTGFMKDNMLFPSLSWVKNNYPDNLKKAFLENGVAGFIDAATFGKFHSGLYDDIKAAYRGDVGYRFKNKYTKDLIDSGLIDNNLFREMDNAEEALKYRFTPEQIAKLKTEGPLTKMARFAADPLYIMRGIGKGTKHLGSMMENTAKATTYIHTFEALMKDKSLVKSIGEQGIKDRAAQIVRDTFFDYSKTSEFERMFAKRMFPFYTFYKNNAAYWGNVLGDPKKLARLNIAENVDQLRGRPPTQEEQKGLPDYMASTGARVLNKDQTGALKMSFNPNSSVIAALNLPGGLLNLSNKNEFIEKANPLLKTPIEIGMNYDTFTGSNLRPSTLPNNQKYLFAGGYYDIALSNLAKSLGIPEAEIPLAVQGVKENNGHPIATDDMQVIMDKIYSTIYPKPILEQAFGAAGKLHSGKESPVEILHNYLFSNSKITDLSPNQMNFNTKKNSSSDKVKKYQKEYREKHGD